MQNGLPQLLNTIEAAKFLQLSPRTLEGYRVRGGGPRFMKAGPGKRTRVLYALSDLYEWIKHTYGSTSEYLSGKGAPASMNYMKLNYDPPAFINVAETEHRVVFSRMHIWRMEKEGNFPARVLIGTRRMAWQLCDVIGWMQGKVDSRGGPPTVLEADDRFISVKETCAITSLSKQSIDRLEQDGDFPRRTQIGKTRIAWLEREVRAWKKATSG